MTEPPNPLDVIGLRELMNWLDGLHEHRRSMIVDVAIGRLKENERTIIAQAAEIERLRAERDTARDLLDSNVSSLGKSLANAGRNVEKLRSALKPYFSHWEQQARGHSEQSSIWHTNHTPVSYKQHEDARTSLTETEPK